MQQQPVNRQVDMFNDYNEMTYANQQQSQSITVHTQETQNNEQLPTSSQAKSQNNPKQITSQKIEEQQQKTLAVSNQANLNEQINPQMVSQQMYQSTPLAQYQQYPLPKPAQSYTSVPGGQGNRPLTQHIVGRGGLQAQNNQGAQPQRYIKDNSPFRDPAAVSLPQNRAYSNNGRPITQGGISQQNFAPQYEDFRVQQNLTTGLSSSMHNTNTMYRKSSDQVQSQPAYQSQQPGSQYKNSIFYSQDKDRGRRQFIAQMINLQNSSQQNEGSQNVHPIGGGGPLQQNYVQPVVTFNSAVNKRKKIKELIYGSLMGKNNPNYKMVIHQKEREELQQEKRGLKIQNNVVKDENIRLKTKLQVLQGDLSKREKDIEALTVKIQQLQQFSAAGGQPGVASTSQNRSQNANQANFSGTNNNLPSQGSVMLTSVGSNIYESFLVSQLKRNIRELKNEISDRDRIIDSLRKDQKMTKAAEMETELNFYIEECARLRSMLEQIMMEDRSKMNQNVDQEIQEQHNQEEQARIEEAFYEKEVELQKERETKTNLQMHLLAEKDHLQKMEHKVKDAEVRLRKYNEILVENKRKHKLLEAKSQEVIQLKSEMDDLRKKANERDAVYNKNKELVTKSYSIQSALESKEKRINELKQQNEEFQDQLRKLSKDGVHPVLTNAIKPQTTPQRSGPTKEGSPLRKSAMSVAQSGSQLTYNIHMLTVIFRSFRSQPIIQSSDTTIYKNYYNNNKQEVEKELDLLRKLDLKSKLWPVLTKKLDTLIQSPLSQIAPQGKSSGLPPSGLSNQQNGGHTIQQFDKFFDELLGVKDKDSKKYLFVHWILKLADKLENMSFAKLIQEIKTNPNVGSESKEDLQQDSVQNQVSQQNVLKESVVSVSQSDPQPQTTRVNESVGETTAQFQPPFSQYTVTPILEDRPNQQNQSPSQKQQTLQKQTTQKQEHQQHSDQKQHENHDQHQQQELKKQKTQQKQQQQSPQKKQDEEEGYQEDEFEKEDNKEENSFSEEQQRILQQLQQQQQQYSHKRHDDIPQQQQPEEEEDDEDQDQDQQQQDLLSDDQMLAIAESVFEMIAKHIVNKQMSVRRIFGKKIQIIPEYEDRQNVEVVSAENFLECLSDVLGISTLQEIEVACLMRVISKPEIGHAILLDEIMQIMDSFGIVEKDQTSSIMNTSGPQDTGHGSSDKKSKSKVQTKKKLIQQLLENPDSVVYSEFKKILKHSQFNLQIIQDIIQVKQYEQLVKSKRKEMNLLLIKRDDFIALIKNETGVGLSLNCIEGVTQVFQVDSKYPDTYQVKLIMNLFEDVLAKYQKEQAEMQAIEQFYKAPSEKEENQTEGINKIAGEVMNFEQMMDENDYEEAENDDVGNFVPDQELLNPITEDAQEEQSSPNIRSVKGKSPI